MHSRELAKPTSEVKEESPSCRATRNNPDASSQWPASNAARARTEVESAEVDPAKQNRRIPKRPVMLHISGEHPTSAASAQAIPSTQTPQQVGMRPFLLRWSRSRIQDQTSGLDRSVDPHPGQDGGSGPRIGPPKPDPVACRNHGTRDRTPQKVHRLDPRLRCGLDPECPSDSRKCLRNRSARVMGSDPRRR